MNTTSTPPQKAGKRSAVIDAPAASGVYAITNLRNGKRYVGSAVNMKTRFSYHRWELKRGHHHSVKLQRAWDKYGDAAFSFDVLLVCAPEMRLFYEQTLIDGLETVKGGYNVLGTAGSTAGRRLSEHTKALLSKINTGKKMSPESRAKMRERMLGKPQPPEVRAKISASMKGRPKSAQTLEKMRARELSAEVRERIAASMRAVWEARRAAA